MEALKVDFKAGKYGTDNMAKPSVLISSSSPDGNDEEMKSDIDGLIRLDNGKSTIQTLKELKLEFEENEKRDAEKREELEWAHGDLLQHITAGTGRSLLEDFFRD